MRTIPLTKGYEAIVDDADYEMLSQWKWCVTMCDGKPYAVSIKNRKTIYMHRFLMGFPASKVDHKNRNGLDNQRRNLRTCTDAQNAMNSKCKAKKKNYYLRGVHRVNPKRKKWYCAVVLGGKSFFGGVFFNPIAAAVARDKLAIRIHGEFAVLNFQTHIPLRVVN